MAATAEIRALTEQLAEQGYIAPPALATTLHLALALDKPLLVEGPPGVGKTALAKATATVLARELVRLQCYEGLDETRALYEWQYSKQLLFTQILRDRLNELLIDATDMRSAMNRLHDLNDEFFSREFLLPRPLLAALDAPAPVVLLIDEVDKSDPEFEALLLELLAEFQVTVPELGTLQARFKPLVILTSNAQRELSDALKRRCLHLYIPQPDLAAEIAILEQQIPQLGQTLTHQLVSFVQECRLLALRKAPAVSETLDWARALLLLHPNSTLAELSEREVEATLNTLFKHEEDIRTVQGQLQQLLSRWRS